MEPNTVVNKAGLVGLIVLSLSTAGCTADSLQLPVRSAFDQRHEAAAEEVRADEGLGDLDGSGLAQEDRHSWNLTFDVQGLSPTIRRFGDALGAGQRAALQAKAVSIGWSLFAPPELRFRPLQRTPAQTAWDLGGDRPASALSWRLH